MQYNRLNNPNALIDALKALDKRVSTVETKGTGPIGFVGDDGVELHIGVQPDGEALIVPFVGDTTPPPIATSPEASAGVGAITVAWDGLFVAGAVQPADFQHLKVLGHKVVNGAITLTVEVGIIRKPLDAVYVNSDVAAVNETWKFSFASVDYNGNTSAESAFSSTVTQTSYKTDVEIASAISSLSSGVTGAQASADGKSKNYYEPTAPVDSPVGTLKKGDTWYDTANGYRLSTWTGTAWQTTQDSAIAQQTADSKGIIYTQNVAPPVSARLPQNLWIDTSLGINLSVTKYWDSTANAGAGAWVAVSSKEAADAQTAAAADAQAKANAAAASAINSQAYSKNASFDDWTGTYPVGYGSWNTGPIKETSIIQRAPFAARFNIPDATAQHGMTFTSTMSHAPNVEFFTVEVDLYLVSGALGGSGMILDWNGMTNNRAQIDFATEIPGAVTGKWYRVSKVLRRPTNATGTWTSMGGFLMGQWTGHGTGAAKNIIFDWFNIRPSTVEEILSYKAPTVAYVDQAEADAISTAMLAAAYSKNPSFEDWSGTVPDNYTSWGSITPTKDTTNKRVGVHGMKFTVPGTEDAGIDFTAPLSHMPNLEYVTVELEFMVTSGTLSAAGVLLDWQGLATPNRAFVRLTDLVPTLTLNKWHRVSAVVKRVGGTGTWTATKGWLMANWGELGTKTAKTIIFDWLNVRPSTAEEILSYKAPTTAYVDQAEADAIAAAAADTNTKLLTKNRTYFQAAKPTGGTYLLGDVWIDNDDGNKVYVYDTAGGFNDFRIAQDTAIDKALYSTFPTDIDTAASNKWLYTKYDKSTSAYHVPQYTDIVGFAGTSSLINDAAYMAISQGEQYIGQLRTIVNVVSTKTVAITATHDDGARVYVDGVSVYSASGYTVGASISFQLTAGWHVIDFFWAEQYGGDGWSAISPLLSSQVTSMFAPVSSTAVASTANTALSSANGKNKVHYSTVDASGTTDSTDDNRPFIEGDTWFKRSTVSPYNIIAQWEFTGGAWVSRKVDGQTLANLDAGTITVGQMHGDRVQANTISTTKLAVTDFNNLFDNGRFTMGTDGLLGWNVGDGTVVTDTGVPSGKALAISGVTGGYPARYQTRDIPFAAGEQIRVKALVKRSATATNAPSVRTMFLDAAKNMISNAGVGITNPAADTWVSLAGKTTAPTNTAFVRLWVEFASINGSTGYVSDIQAYRMNAGELLIDGALDAFVITGPTIQTESASARGIKLTSTEFAGYDGTTGNKSFSLTSAGALSLKGAITSGSTITGSAISGGTVTGSTIQTEVTTDRGIKLTSAELSGFDAAGVKNFSLTSTGALTLRGEIKSGSTIEGARLTGTQGIETSTSANTGVKINNVGIKAYDAGNNLSFHLDATTGFLEVPGLKANSIKGTMIEAGAVTTDKLKVGDFTNWVVDPYMIGTGQIGGATYLNSSSTSVSAGAPFSRLAQLSSRDNLESPSQARPVRAGDTFYAEVWVRADSAAIKNIRLGLWSTSEDGVSHNWDSTGTLSDPSYKTAAAPSEGLAGWVKLKNTFVVPATVAGKNIATSRAWIQVDGTTTAEVAGWYITGWTMYRQAGATVIEKGAIKTDHITLGTLDGGVISAGTVKALQIGAKAITADKLVITSTDNLVQEATFNAAGISWELPSGFAINNTAGRNSSPAMVITNTAALQTSYNAVGNPTKVPIEVQSNGGAAYRVIGWVNSSVSASASGAYISARFTSSTGTTSTATVSLTGTLAADTWTEITGIVTAPANTVSVAFSINSDATLSTGTLKWDMVSVTRASTGSLIVDGAIDGKTITGAIMQTEVTASRGVKLTSSGLTAYTSTGATAFSLSASTGRATMSGRVTTGLPGEAGSVLLPAAESSNLTTSGLFISRTGTLAGGTTAGVYVNDATTTSAQNLFLRGHEGGHVEIDNGVLYIRMSGARVGNFSNWALGDAANGSNYLPNLWVNPSSGTGYIRLSNAPTSSSAANAIIAVTPEGVMYRSTSSIKYKADVKDWDAAYRALNLRPRSWVDRNPIDPEAPMTRYYGYIAEEVAEILPEFVTYDEFGDPESVTYDRMPSPATVAILKDIDRRLKAAGL